MLCVGVGAHTLCTLAVIWLILLCTRKHTGDIIHVHYTTGKSQTHKNAKRLIRKHQLCTLPRL